MFLGARHLLIGAALLQAGRGTTKPQRGLRPCPADEAGLVQKELQMHIRKWARKSEREEEASAAGQLLPKFYAGLEGLQEKIKMQVLQSVHRFDIDVQRFLRRTVRYREGLENKGNNNTEKKLAIKVRRFVQDWEGLLMPFANSTEANFDSMMTLFRGNDSFITGLGRPLLNGVLRSLTDLAGTLRNAGTAEGPELCDALAVVTRRLAGADTILSTQVLPPLDRLALQEQPAGPQKALRKIKSKVQTMVASIQQEVHYMHFTVSGLMKNRLCAAEEPLGQAAERAEAADRPLALQAGLQPKGKKSKGSGEEAEGKAGAVRKELSQDVELKLASQEDQMQQLHRAPNDLVAAQPVVQSVYHPTTPPTERQQVAFQPALPAGPLAKLSMPMLDEQPEDDEQPLGKAVLRPEGWFKVLAPQSAGKEAGVQAHGQAKEGTERPDSAQPLWAAPRQERPTQAAPEAAGPLQAAPRPAHPTQLTPKSAESVPAVPNAAEPAPVTPTLDRPEAAESMQVMSTQEGPKAAEPMSAVPEQAKPQQTAPKRKGADDEPGRKATEEALKTIEQKAEAEAAADPKEGQRRAPTVPSAAKAAQEAVRGVAPAESGAARGGPGIAWEVKLLAAAAAAASALAWP